MNKDFLNKELIDFIQIGHIQGVLSCLELGADINYQDDFLDQTPIIVAYMNDRVKLVFMLLNRGADPTIVDKDGENFIDYLRHLDNRLAHNWHVVRNKIREYDVQKPIISVFPHSFPFFKKYDLLNERIKKEHPDLNICSELNLF